MRRRHWLALLAIDPGMLLEDPWSGRCVLGEKQGIETYRGDVLSLDPRG